MKRKTEVAILLRHLFETGCIDRLDDVSVKDALGKGLKELRKIRAAESAMSAGKKASRESLYRRIRLLETEVARCHTNK